MIIRIITAGQFEVDDSEVDVLNQLDDELIAAVEARDEARFSELLNDIHDKVIAMGTPVNDDYLGSSDLILPDLDATIEEVEKLLGDDGLIPG